MQDPAVEKNKIMAALKQANGNKTMAAKLLKIDRSTLYVKMRQYELT
ncbi:helix-turn-helix domain-containing protein [Barnesiella sp. WM24]|nr:helix-turn-helix domain-containing protein [Barnesiella sp. WM24]